MAFTHGGGLRIEAEGLEETIRALKFINKDILREFKRGLKEDAKPILTEARNNAQAIARTGAYASSMALRTLANGVRIASDDPGAGTIEFSNAGAVYLSGRRRGLPVGVPKGNPPRALVKAVLDNENAVVDAVETRIEQTIRKYLNG